MNLVNADLENADLMGAELDQSNLAGATLSGANFTHARLISANLEEAALYGADFTHADLSMTDLNGAMCLRAVFRDAGLVKSSLDGADLTETDFRSADLDSADLSYTRLTRAKFTGAYLNKTNFSGATLNATEFVGNDLSSTIGLTLLRHYGPSRIDLDTIFRSGTNIPIEFLRGCGVPEDFITYMHSIVTDPIQYHSCFISYSHKDEEFAQRLHARMREKGLRVWYAAEDMAGGKKLHEQIEQAIQLHDRLLIVLSDHSLKSEWVMTEIRKARKQELQRGSRKLFPISLVDFATIKAWECFDADSGKDLAVEMREYYIPDFSNWKNHDSFEVAFDRLYRDLKVESTKA